MIKKKIYKLLLLIIIAITPYTVAMESNVNPLNIQNPFAMIQEKKGMQLTLDSPTEEDTRAFSPIRKKDHLYTLTHRRKESKKKKKQSSKEDHFHISEDEDSDNEYTTGTAYKKFPTVCGYYICPYKRCNAQPQEDGNDIIKHIKLCHNKDFNYKTFTPQSLNKHDERAKNEAYDQTEIIDDFDFPNIIQPSLEEDLYATRPTTMLPPNENDDTYYNHTHADEEKEKEKEKDEVDAPLEEDKSSSSSSSEEKEEEKKGYQRYNGKYKKHMDLYIDSWVCKECDKRFYGQPRDAKKHLQTHKIKEETANRGKNSKYKGYIEIYDNSWKCITCSKTYKGKPHHVGRHLAQHGIYLETRATTGKYAKKFDMQDNKYVCPICNHKIVNGNKMVTHIQSKHNPNFDLETFDPNNFNLADYEPKRKRRRLLQGYQGKYKDYITVYEDYSWKCDTCGMHSEDNPSKSGRHLAKVHGIDLRNTQKKKTRKQDSYNSRSSHSPDDDYDNFIEKNEITQDEEYEDKEKEQKDEDDIWLDQDENSSSSSEEEEEDIIQQQASNKKVEDIFNNLSPEEFLLLTNMMKTKEPNVFGHPPLEAEKAVQKTTGLIQNPNQQILPQQQIQQPTSSIQKKKKKRIQQKKSKSSRKKRKKESKSKFDAHLIWNAENEKWDCKHCKKIGGISIGKHKKKQIAQFKRKGNAGPHLRKYHPSLQIKKRKSKSKYDEKFKKSTNGEYTCPYPHCSKKYPRGVELTKHIKTHDPTFDYDTYDPTTPPTPAKKRTGHKRKRKDHDEGRKKKKRKYKI